MPVRLRLRARGPCPAWWTTNTNLVARWQRDILPLNYDRQNLVETARVPLAPAACKAAVLVLDDIPKLGVTGGARSRIVPVPQTGALPLKLPSPQIWSCRRESNSLFPPYEGGAFPIKLRQRGRSGGT
jgi:hypothetical protein